MYRHALFVTDWIHRRILAVQLNRQDGGTTAASEVFLEDESLHATDLAVGPDGGLYFVTGGGGTGGGLYRVRWKGQPAPATTNLGTGSARRFASRNWSRPGAGRRLRWSRPKWAPPGTGTCRASRPARPIPGCIASGPWSSCSCSGRHRPTELLLKLARVDDVRVRAKAAELLGLHPGPRHAGGPAGAARPTATATSAAPPAKRSAAAGKTSRWRSSAGCSSPRTAARAGRPAGCSNGSRRNSGAIRCWPTTTRAVLIQGCLALLIADPTPDHATAVLERLRRLMDQFLSDRDFTDALRVVQLAYARGPHQTGADAGIAGPVGRGVPLQERGNQSRVGPPAGLSAGVVDRRTVRRAPAVAASGRRRRSSTWCCTCCP